MISTDSPTVAHLDAADADGLHAGWWSPSAGLIRCDDQGRRFLSDGSTIEDFPPDTFALVPQPVYQQLKEDAASKLHVSTLTELSETTDLVEIVQTMCRHLPDNSVRAPAAEASA